MRHLGLLIALLAVPSPACSSATSNGGITATGDVADSGGDATTGTDAASNDLSTACILGATTCTSTSPSVQCATYGAHPYDTARGCVSGQWVAVRCCGYTGDSQTFSCPDDESFSCIQRSLADGGVELFQDPYSWMLAPGFARCDQSAISQAVSNSSTPTCK